MLDWRLLNPPMKIRKSMLSAVGDRLTIVQSLNELYFAHDRLMNLL